MTDLTESTLREENPRVSQVPKETRLQALARHARDAQARAEALGMSEWSDDFRGVSEVRCRGWMKVLSSLATGEAVEGTLMGPLQDAMALDAEASEYLETHAQDERRHHGVLVAYLRNTFGFEKRGRTVTDQVLYDGVFPRLAQVLRVKPVYGFALGYCYEDFSVALYGPLRAQAEADGATRLAQLIQSIHKDELRHVAGMDELLRSELTRSGGMGALERLILQGILKLVVADVDTRSWAIQNRRLRESLLSLGISPEEATDAALASVRKTLKVVEELSC